MKFQCTVTVELIPRWICAVTSSSGQGSPPRANPQRASSCTCDAAQHSAQAQNFAQSMMHMFPRGVCALACNVNEGRLQNGCHCRGRAWRRVSVGCQHRYFLGRRCVSCLAFLWGDAFLARFTTALVLPDAISSRCGVVFRARFLAVSPGSLPTGIEAVFVKKGVEIACNLPWSCLAGSCGSAMGYERNTTSKFGGEAARPRGPMDKAWVYGT